MTDMVTANLHEVGEVVKIGWPVAWPILKYGGDKYLEHSKQREALADCNTRLEDCEEARSRSEAKRRVLQYVLVFVIAAFLVGSMFYTIAPRSQL